MSRELLLEAAAGAIAMQVMELVGDCFREDEQRDLYAAIYEAASEGLQVYQRQSGRLSELSNEN